MRRVQTVKAWRNCPPAAVGSASSVPRDLWGYRVSAVLPRSGGVRKRPSLHRGATNDNRSFDESLRKARSCQDDLEPRWRRSVPAWHDGHEQGAQGSRGLLSAHGAAQGGSGSALRRVLGRLHDAAGAIVERDDHDDDRTGQRGSPDLSSRVGLGLRRKRRHPGSGWLVALIGVRVSLSSYALPMIFVGALVKLLGNGRIAARGGRARRLSACALRTDDSATGHGRARRELASLGPTGRPWWARSRLGIRRAFGLRTLVVFGLVMTAVMQSSTASIAVTLSAYHAGAIGVDQDCAPIIGQNIGTATSSAMAAQAKRKGKILAKRNRPGRQNHNILAPPRPKPSPYRSSSFRFLHDERR